MSRPRTYSSSCNGCGTSVARQARPRFAPRRLTSSGARDRSSQTTSTRDRRTHPRAARHRRAALRAPRDSVGVEDRSRDVRSRGVRQIAAAGGQRRPRGSRGPSYPADRRGGRWEIFHDVLAAAVLGWRRVTKRRAGVAARDATRRADATAPRVPRVRRAPRPRGHGRSRPVRVLPAQRGARSGAGRAERPARRERAFRGGHRSRARDRARPRGGSARAHTASRAALRDLLDASRLRAVIDTGHPVVGFDLHPSAARALVVGDDGIARLFDLATGDLRWSHRVDGGGAAFANGGRSVVLIESSSLVTLDAATGAQRRRPVPVALAGPVEELVPSTDGRSAIVVTLGKPRARAVALATGDVIGRVKHPRAVTDAAYAPTGRLAASSGRDWAGRVWDTATWREVREPLLGHNGQVLAIAFDTAGTGGSRRPARIRRRASGGFARGGRPRPSSGTPRP